MSDWAAQRVSRGILWHDLEEARARLRLEDRAGEALGTEVQRIVERREATR